MKVSCSRLLIFILSVLILLSSIPTHAEVVQSSVTGRITTDSSRDLSGIEIRVYSAIPVPCNENNSGTLYFGELYSFSVFTDEIGGFSFVKPSNYCSLSIVLESLPDNYGVSCQTQFLPPHRTFVDIVIKQVHKVETSLVDGIISPSFFSEEGIPLLASYSIYGETIDFVSRAGVSVSTEELSGISDAVYQRFVGTITVGSKKYPFCLYDDISSFSLYDKVNTLYDYGVIAEGEKITLYYDLFCNSSELLCDCGTPIVCQIDEYFDSSHDGCSKEQHHEAESHSLGTRSFPPYTNFVEGYAGTYTIRVYYDTTQNMSLSNAVAVLSECLLIYNYYITNLNFTAPIPYDNNSYYAVYLAEDLSVNAYTQPQSGGGSYICLKYSLTSSGSIEYKRSLAHEFTHAIMFAYGISYISSNKWFHESFASMSALVYRGTSDNWFDEKTSTFLNESFNSIYSQSSEAHIYGALLYPLYIYNYLGGWSTIRSVFGNFSSSGNGYDAISNCYNISSYANAFLASETYNYCPQAFYTAYATTEWGTGRIENYPIPFSAGTYMAVQPMACNYRRFSSPTNLGTVYFTFEITGPNADGMMLNTVKETMSGGLVINTVSASFSGYDRITIQQTDFGGTIKKLTLVPVNTSTSGTPIQYKITSST